MDNTTNYFHHDIEDFKKCPLGADENKLRILQWNVRGINDMNKFDSVLQILELCECSFDVIASVKRGLIVLIARCIKLKDMIAIFPAEVNRTVALQFLLKII